MRIFSSGGTPKVWRFQDAADEWGDCAPVRVRFGFRDAEAPHKFLLANSSWDRSHGGVSRMIFTPSRWAGASGLALLAMTVSGGARAQLVDQFLLPYVSAGVAGLQPSVLGRQQEDYEQSGVRVGSFMIRSLLQESGGYETNVLATPSPRGSPFVETNAALEAASDVSRATVRAQLSMDDTRYLELPRQSSTDWSARLRGSYDVGRDVISAQVSHTQLAEAAGDLDVPQGLDEAIPYRIEDGQIAYRANFARISLTPAFDVSAYRYDNGMANGVFYPQEYRDRTLLTPSITVAYEASPGRSVVVVARNARGLYTRAQAGVARQDYEDAALLAGLDYEVSSAIRLHVLAGYQIRSFDSSAYQTIQSPVAEASAVWTPTRLTTVTADVTRRIADSADDTVGGLTETAGRLRVEHEYLRRVLLLGTASIVYDSYRDSQDQTLYRAGLGSTYLLNRQVGLTLSYDFVARESRSGALVGTVPIGGSYTDHRFILQVRLTL
jgi:hypothetical protein